MAKLWLKIHKPFARLIKNKRERTQTNKMRNEGDITNDRTEIQLHANNFDTLEEMDKFLETQNHQD